MAAKTTFCYSLFKCISIGTMSASTQTLASWTSDQRGCFHWFRINRLIKVVEWGQLVNSMSIPKNGVKLAPSILSADMARLLADQVAAGRRGRGRPGSHVDVMDGHFVPNITFGPVVVRWLKPHCPVPVEVHLMIAEPERYLDAFSEAGADTLIVHQEGAVHLHRTVQAIRALGKRAGVAINPATPAVMLEEILPDLDLVLVMTVNPGFGGQKFLHEMLPKIQRVRGMIDSAGKDCELEVDGGVEPHTAPLVVAAGARVLVAGSAVYGDPGGATAGINRLKAALTAPGPSHF